MKPRWLIAGTAGLILGLVFGAPADQLFSWFDLRDNEDIQVYEITGNLHSGSAGMLMLAGVPLYDVDWQMRPLWLLLGSAAFEVIAATDSGRIEGDISMGLFTDFAASNLILDTAVSTFSPAFNAPINPLEGRLQADLRDITFDEGRLEYARGMLSLTGARWLLAQPPLDVGSYRAEVDTQDGVVAATISDETGPIELSGDLRLSAEQTYTYDLRLRPNADASEQLRELMQQLGRPDAQNWYRLRGSGAY